MPLQTVTPMQDNDGHWYVIPSNKLENFIKLLSGGEDTEQDFIDEFDEYMTGGDLNIIQLWADID